MGNCVQKCVLCSHCKVVLVAEHQPARPIATEDIKEKGGAFMRYALQKYDNPGKVKRQLACRRWERLFSFNKEGITRQLDACSEYDPNDLDCDDNPIDRERYFNELAKKDLIGKFKVK